MADNYNYAPQPQSLETVGNAYYRVWNDTTQACNRYSREWSALKEEWGYDIIRRDVIVRGSAETPSTLVSFSDDKFGRPTVWFFTFDNHLDFPDPDGFTDPFGTCVSMPNTELEQEKPVSTEEGMADFASELLYAMSHPGAPEHNQLSIERFERVIRTEQKDGESVNYRDLMYRHTLIYSHLPDGGLGSPTNVEGNAIDDETIAELHRLSVVLQRACDVVNTTTEQLIFPHGRDFDPGYDFVPPLYAPDSM